MLPHLQGQCGTGSIKSTAKSEGKCILTTLHLARHCGLQLSCGVSCSSPDAGKVASNVSMHTADLMAGKERNCSLLIASAELLTAPGKVGKISDCTSVACGAEFTMWLCDGKLWSAGSPQYGQLGHGTDHEYNAKDCEHLSGLLRYFLCRRALSLLCIYLLQRKNDSCCLSQILPLVATVPG